MASASSSGSHLALAGGISGVVEAICVQPFDIVKTRFQLNTGTNAGVRGAIRALLDEGGLLRLYRGILPEMAGMIPKSSAMFWTYEQSKRVLTNLGGRWGTSVAVPASASAAASAVATKAKSAKANGGRPVFETTTLTAFAAGTLSGYPEAITVTPFQVIKVRLQTKEYLGRYKNSFDCLRRVLREEGPRALTTGLGPTCWRNCVWNGVYFGLMHALKDQLPKTDPNATGLARAGDLVGTLVSGTVGGIFATCFNAPFDVAKSRFQSQLPLSLQAAAATAAGTPVPTKLKYRYTLQTLFVVAREEGIRAVYKGFTPKVLRMSIGGGVSMCAFETACYFLRPKLATNNK